MIQYICEKYSFRFVAALAVLLSAFLSSCDGGLDPTTVPDETIVVGTVEFVGASAAWPPADSVKEVRVVGFRSFPPEDLISEVLSGKAFISDTLPTFTDFATFRLELSKPIPSELQYIAVALRFGDNLFEDWRVVGVYATEANHKQHRALPIQPGATNTANIKVVFSDPPPQPF